MQEAKKSSTKSTWIAIFVIAAALFFMLKYYGPSWLLQYDLFLYAMLAAVAGIALIYAASLSIEGYGTRRNAEKDYKALSGVFKMLAYAVLVIVILDMLGVNITGILVGAGFLGIVIGLAAQNTLGNLFAGMMLLYAKPFHSGDEIELSTWQYGLIAQTYPHGNIYPGITGKIDKIGIIYTTIIEKTGMPVFVPNSIVIQALIFNKNMAVTNSVQVRVELDIKKDFQKFKKMAKSAFSNDKYIAKNAKDVQIVIDDINTAYYGVGILFSCNSEASAKVSQHIKEASLRVSSKL